MFDLEISKSWVFGQTRYLSGTLGPGRLDVELLQLEPLGLTCWPEDPFVPDEEEAVDHLPPDIARELVTRGECPRCEMEQILPEDVVELQWEDDPIVEAAALARAGHPFAAASILRALLATDLRCLDAHSHLGIFELESNWPDSLERATRHYRVGVAIGELGLGRDIPFLLPWGAIDNRPYLRCLHGLGVARWRLGDLDEAKAIFRRLLLLNPDDNQGIRFLWPAVVAGESWEAGAP